MKKLLRKVSKKRKLAVKLLGLGGLVWGFKFGTINSNTDHYCHQNESLLESNPKNLKIENGNDRLIMETRSTRVQIGSGAILVLSPDNSVELQETIMVNNKPITPPVTVPYGVDGFIHKAPVTNRPGRPINTPPGRTAPTVHYRQAVFQAPKETELSATDKEQQSSDNKKVSRGKGKGKRSPKGPRGKSKGAPKGSPKSSGSTSTEIEIETSPKNQKTAEEKFMPGFVGKEKNKKKDQSAIETATPTPTAKLDKQNTKKFDFTTVSVAKITYKDRDGNPISITHSSLRKIAYSHPMDLSIYNLADRIECPVQPDVKKFQRTDCFAITDKSIQDIIKKVSELTQSSDPRRYITLKMPMPPFPSQDTMAYLDKETGDCIYCHENGNLWSAGHYTDEEITELLNNPDVIQNPQP